MTGPVPPPSGAGALSEPQKAELAKAERGLKAVHRAQKFAAVNAWTLAIFAGLTLLFGLGDPFTMLVGAALAATAWNEFRGKAELEAFEPAGARRLGWNQVAILGVVVVYCGVHFWKARFGEADPRMAELEELAGFEEGWIAELTAMAYLAVAVIVAGIQLLTARFHFAREGIVREWVRTTPEWVREVLEVRRGPRG